MSSIFSKIIKGEIPCYKIAEDDNHFAFLDINPNSKGHTLCVPKLEVDKIFDLTESQYLDLMQFARKVAIGLEKTIECNRVGISVIGLEVPHAHVHLIPIHDMEDMRFIKKTNMLPEELKNLAIEIQNNTNL